MNSARRPLIAANWKMNGLKADGTALAGAVAARAKAVGTALAGDILICPPATLIDAVAEALADSPVALGGQDCSAEPSGAFTGDIAAAMLRDLGCSTVIVGHSERRAGHHETDAAVRAKATAALAEGLTAIVCVGETATERDEGRALDVVGGQVLGSVPDGATAATLVVAYEPVWAIGTGRVPTLDDIAAMHRHIRELLAGKVVGGVDVRILYGGSVKPSNAREILALDDVDGALVGGASLKADEFWAIVEAAPRR
ncbi:triosephosphate isomerase [Aliidongia dinghuensis]|uniref:Triosephosphate isomerase n=1 Tax=Aliidongia dinghuensis TaxID=1867774 RepID=A0A8J3E4J9_9PROT|nr:triose-phosphate isomerase [Aliidongia dinghuensis]GGF15041.1 triosephosphate isomerase [Aliidongia dinghuensis]